MNIYKNFETVVIPVTKGKIVRMISSDGENFTKEFYAYQKTRAIKKSLAFGRETAHHPWVSIDKNEVKFLFKKEYTNSTPSAKSTNDTPFYSGDDFLKDERIKNIRYIHEESIKLRPDNLIISDLKWKTLIRTALRADNIMLTGPAGSGKTQTARAVAMSLERPFFYFNMGSMQDARSALIGNLHFSKEKGTYLSESEFIAAIQTPNAVIMLDEISRSTHDAWNIMMTVLDKGQRYVRVDEQASGDRRVVNVHETVCFIATANIGIEYTANRVMDKAFIDRFKIIEIDVLNKDQEFSLLKKLFPEINPIALNSIAEIVAASRYEVERREESKISSAISTRMSVEMASMLYDGFTIHECAEVAIYPFYPNDGVDSERVFITQIVQKNLPSDLSWDNLFVDLKNNKPVENSEDDECEVEQYEYNSKDLFFTVDDVQL